MVNSHNQWQILERFVEIRSPWLTLIGEKLKNEQEKILDYWRVEKADSVVIITMQNGQFILPKPIYRHGLGETTLDFPGGRVLPEQQVIDTVLQILVRELGISESDILNINPLNEKGWAVNSSFSNQKLYGFTAEIEPTVTINSDKLNLTVYPINGLGIKKLLKDLACLQCRAILLEWWQYKMIDGKN
jgi:hypothetical protein